MGQAEVAVGSVLAGKYRVDRVLGVGGMGMVVAATHLHLFQTVALKFMLPEALANNEMVQRFLQEARNAVRLHSEHVCRISDVGTLDNGAPYIVMEYMQGTDLGALKDRQGPMPVASAADFILQALEAIAEAHALGIVHRDLKPANLFVTQGADGSPLVKVLDFGIAKATGAFDMQMTRTATVMGSPAYMSPEQLRSARGVDGRSDIWSLGVILYELVTGRTPFAAETLTELCLRISMDPLPQMPKLQGVTVPPGFETVVRRCLEKNPEERFQNVAEMAVDLARFASPASRVRVDRIARIMGGEGIAMQSHAQGSTAVASSIDRTLNRTRQSAKAKGSRKTLILGGAIGAAAAIVGITVAAMTGGGSTEKPQPAALVTPVEPPVPAPAPAPEPPKPVVEAKPKEEPVPAVAVAPAPVVVPATPDAGAAVAAPTPPPPAPEPVVTPPPEPVVTTTTTASKPRTRTKTASRDPKPEPKPETTKPVTQKKPVDPLESPD